MKISNLLKEYFDGLQSLEESKNVSSCKIISEVKEHVTNEWIVVQDPTRLHCRFLFEDYAALVQFMDDLLEYQKIKNHHGKIICDENQVIVEVYTKDLDNITELDVSYSDDVMSIYKNHVLVPSYV